MPEPAADAPLDHRPAGPGLAIVLKTGNCGALLLLEEATGLLPAGRVLSHVRVFELPAHVARHGKLLFAADVAIIPEPDLPTKVQILEYCLAAARSFGVAAPRAALLAAASLPSSSYTSGKSCSAAAGSP